MNDQLQSTNKKLKQKLSIADLQVLTALSGINSSTGAVNLVEDSTQSVASKDQESASENQQ